METYPFVYNISAMLEQKHKAQNNTIEYNGIGRV